MEISDPEQVNEVFSKIEGKFQKDIICMICENLPYKPVCCPECQELFCTYCISEKLKKEKKCPICNCRLQEESLEKLHKKLMNIINSQEIMICPLCQEMGFIYERYLPHLFNDCPFFKISCPFNCGGKFLRKDSLEHPCFYSAHNCQELNYLQNNYQNTQQLGCLQILTQKLRVVEQKLEQREAKILTINNKKNKLIKLQLTHLQNQQQKLLELLFRQIEYTYNFTWRALGKYQGLAMHLRCWVCKNFDKSLTQCGGCRKITCQRCLCSQENQAQQQECQKNYRFGNMPQSSLTTEQMLIEINGNLISQCPYCLKQMVSQAKNLHDHFKNDCLMAEFECYCGEMTCKADLNNHILTCFYVNNKQLEKYSYSHLMYTSHPGEKDYQFKEFFLYKSIVDQYRTNQQFMDLIKIIDDDDDDDDDISLPHGNQIE